jgi:hypothetical protein
VLLVDDSADFRQYLNLTFSRAAWQVREWEPRSTELDVVEDLDPMTLTAIVADWDLGKDCEYSGLEVLSAMRRRSNRVACILYSMRAFEDEEWQRTRDSGERQDIRVLNPGTVSRELIRNEVLKEVKRLNPHFEEPRQDGQEYESWITSESPGDPSLEQAVDAVGKGHLLSLIRQLFPERGPRRPMSYELLRAGFSGARVFRLKILNGGQSGMRRYILKLAQGSTGFESLESERLSFHKNILNSREGPKLKGYVADELRPALGETAPAKAGEGWYGIAYREIGNGTGQVMSFRDVYVDHPLPAEWRRSPQKLEQYLGRLYGDCFGHGFHHAARSVRRKLWSEPADTGCYTLVREKQTAIFDALEELQPRARVLLNRAFGQNTAERCIAAVILFIKNGICGRGANLSVFHRTFDTLAAGTHGDLHMFNVLAVERDGDIDPFVIDFSEFQQHGHPFYDYVRMENDIRLRLMSSEDGSDILDELFGHWLNAEERLPQFSEPLRFSEGTGRTSGNLAYVDKAYAFIALIRALAQQNLITKLHEPNERPSPDSFSVQYTAALLHRTLVSLASLDIVPHKKILALWLGDNLIARLGLLLTRLG